MGILRSRKSTLDQLKSRPLSQSMQHRDVYASQQIERSEIAAPQTGFSRLLVGGFVLLLLGVFLWIMFVRVSPVSFSTYPNRYEYIAIVQGEEQQRFFTYTDDSGYYDTSSDVLWEDPCDVPVPSWYVTTYGVPADMTCLAQEGKSGISWKGLVWWFVFMGIAGGGLWLWLRYNLHSQNVLNDTKTLNQYDDDQHIAIPEEIMDMFDFFPDAGAHADIHVSSMISHVMLSNKGVKTIDVTRRADEDICDESGEVDLFAGEALVDDEGNELVDRLPLFDESFADELFDVSGIPDENGLRKWYDPNKISYNPDGKRKDKAPYNTVADLINETWELPSYETQRPAGAYIVDTAPVNTMNIAMTRAGKGQGIIEPTIDMWLRMKRQQNIIANDPKGELLLKFYVPATMRGYQVVQFNMINPMKTDIYNPLGIAAAAARDGDIEKCSLLIKNIADVFFPVDGADDPVWPNAANNAFQRAAFALIDFYLEEEKQMRDSAEASGKDLAELEVEINAIWSKVSLYNCYQFFVRLASVKKTNPLTEVENRKKAGEFDGALAGTYAEVKAEAEAKSFLWEGKESIDLLTLYFNATKALPKNGLRELLVQVDDSLRSMANAEKMLASVYGIAITAMSFFTDPTIASLTSGAPSQNVDLSSFSFPRCLGVRFNDDYVKKESFEGLRAHWDAFSDAKFETKLDSHLYSHDDTVKRNGWAYYYCDGIFPDNEVFLRLEIRTSKTKHLIETFYFKFTKNYLTSLNGLVYIRNEITNEKIVRGGILQECQLSGDNLEFAPSTFTAKRVHGSSEIGQTPVLVDKTIPKIRQTYVRYEEKPKALFLVTPPSRLTYAKIILILIKQLFDTSVEQSYVAKPSQKPLYENFYMLDELGNLQNEGNGIPGLDTMLSIGLGQGQLFELILQTLQQLIAVYGEDVDKIIQGNTSNIVFLKSTDDSLLQTLESMSGKRHVVRIEQEMVTVNEAAPVQKIDPKVQYTKSVQEEPVIKYNDMAFIADRNSMVFRAGTPPIWNRNELVLPMSWKLTHATGIKQPGEEYTIQTVPTSSTVLEFDVRTNQPNFIHMVSKRIEQAVIAEAASTMYAATFDYTEHDLAQLNPDMKSEQIMEIINELLDNMRREKELNEEVESNFIIEDDFLDPNTDLADVLAEMDPIMQDNRRPRFGRETITRNDLVQDYGLPSSRVSHYLDDSIVRAFKNTRHFFAKDAGFTVRSDNSLWNATNDVCYIEVVNNDQAAKRLADAATDPSTRVFSEGESEEIVEEFSTRWIVRDEFIEFLASQESWEFANGRFDWFMRQADKETE